MSNRHCGQALELVYQYLDQELTWTGRVRVRWHLRRCPPCTGMYSFEDRLRSVVREKCREEIPAEVMDRLRTALRSELPPA